MFSLGHHKDHTSTGNRMGPIFKLLILNLRRSLVLRKRNNKPKVELLDPKDNKARLHYWFSPSQESIWNFLLDTSEEICLIRSTATLPAKEGALA